MITPYDVEPNKFMDVLAKKLENEYKLSVPKYAGYVKTGSFKERLPEQDNFWYIRCASIMRKMYRDVIGVSKLRKLYGGKKKHSFKNRKRTKAAGSLIRDALQELEGADLIKKVVEERRNSKDRLVKVIKGRTLTPKGRKLLDGVALSL